MRADQKQITGVNRQCDGLSPLSYVQCKAFHLNGVQTELKCKPNVKRCKRFVFVGHSPLLHHNTLKTKAITLFQADHILTRFVFPPLAAPMVRSAVINGSGDIIFENGVDVNHGIDWTVNGSGDIDADKVKCRKMNVAVNGSGDIALGDVSGVEMNMAVNGSGDVAVKSISADRVNSAVNGSGDVNIKGISADEVNGTVNGSGDVTLSGKCAKANYSLSGSGDIAGSYLKAKQATVYTSPRSTGDISCYASEKIIINKEGKNSDVSYSGNPRTVEKNSTKGRHHRHSNDD